MRCCFIGLLLFLNSPGVAAEPTAPQPTEQAIFVECHGKLRCGRVAIGSETTGTTIKFGDVVWELSFSDEASKRFAHDHHKDQVTVKGKLRRVTGIARPQRWIVDVTQIRDPEAGEKQDSATTTVCGKLQKQDGGVVVSCNDITWPVDLSKDANLKAKADSLSMKTVVVKGNVERLPGAQLPVQVMIDTKSIDLASVTSESKR